MSANQIKVYYTEKVLPQFCVQYMTVGVWKFWCWYYEHSKLTWVQWDKLPQRCYMWKWWLMNSKCKQYRCQMIDKIHIWIIIPSFFCCLSRARSGWQQPKQSSPRVFCLGHFIQLLMGDPRVFLHQPRDIIPPLCHGSTLVGPSGTCPKYLNREDPGDILTRLSFNCPAKFSFNSDQRHLCKLIEVFWVTSKLV